MNVTTISQVQTQKMIIDGKKNRRIGSKKIEETNRNRKLEQRFTIIILYIKPTSLIYVNTNKKRKLLNSESKKTKKRSILKDKDKKCGSQNVSDDKKIS